MARSPFAPPVPPAQPSTPLRPATAGYAQQAAPAERRTLVVGRGISVQGSVQDAERLVVEGTVEATSINASELAIAQGGVFKGEAEVDEAEVAGTIDGTLIARTALIVRATGRVLGTARCRRLQVEDGGQITGRIEMLNDGAPLSSSSSTSAPLPSTPVAVSAATFD
jgi:cytoskeletal protein CcmA (bactofilin family)